MNMYASYIFFPNPNTTIVCYDHGLKCSGICSLGRQRWEIERVGEMGGGKLKKPWLTKSSSHLREMKNQHKIRPLTMWKFNLKSTKLNLLKHEILFQITTSFISSVTPPFFKRVNVKKRLVTLLDAKFVHNMFNIYSLYITFCDAIVKYLKWTTMQHKLVMHATCNLAIICFSCNSHY